MVKEGVIKDDQLAKALERQIIFGGRLGTNLVEMGVVAEEALAKFLSRHLHVPYAEPSKFEEVPQDALDSMNRDQVQKYTAFPFEKERTRLHVAMKDPNDMAKLDEMRFVIGIDIRAYIASEMRISFAMEKYYSVKRDLRYVNIQNADEGFSAKIDPSAVGIPSMPPPVDFKSPKPSGPQEEYFLGDESQLEYGSAAISDGEAIADALSEDLEIPVGMYSEEPAVSPEAPTVAAEPMSPPFAEPAAPPPPAPAPVKSAPPTPSAPRARTGPARPRGHRLRGDRRRALGGS